MCKEDPSLLDVMPRIIVEKVLMKECGLPDSERNRVVSSIAKTRRRLLKQQENKETSTVARLPPTNPTVLDLTDDASETKPKAMAIPKKEQEERDESDARKRKRFVEIHRDIISMATNLSELPANAPAHIREDLENDIARMTKKKNSIGEDIF